MTTLHGVIVRGTPYILADILKRGFLRLETTPVPEDAVRISVTVDTGFTGGFSLPENTLRLLKLDRLGFVPYILADSSTRIVPTYLGHVVVGAGIYQARFIPGQPLMGIEFMTSAFSSLRVEFKSATVKLT